MIDKEFLGGLIIFMVGVFLGMWIILHTGDVVMINGKKDKFQTIEWNEKTYRLVPLSLDSSK